MPSCRDVHSTMCHWNEPEWIKLVAWHPAGMLDGMDRYFKDKGELDAFIRQLPWMACPRCGARGAWVRHGYIRGAVSPNAYGVRGWRIFCDPDSPRSRGCGYAPGLWLSITLLHRCFTADELLRFILGLCANLSVRAAWRRSCIGLSERTGYRLHHRLRQCQSVLRVALCTRAPPPGKSSARSSFLQTLEHLKGTFGSVSAYQQSLQKDILAVL